MLSMLQKLRQHGQQVDFMKVAGVDHFNIVENLQLEDFLLTKAIVGLVTDVSELLPAEEQCCAEQCWWQQDLVIYETWHNLE